MRHLASLMLACSVAAAVPRAAQACGGFFCNNQVPVDQSGEQILFSIDGSHVTAHIQISYQGDAKSFAWVVPVARKPTITLGNRAVFQQLMGQTQPQFTVLWPQTRGACNSYPGGGFGFSPGGATGAPPPTASPADKSVTVVEM